MCVCVCVCVCYNPAFNKVVMETSELNKTTFSKKRKLKNTEKIYYSCMDNA